MDGRRLAFVFLGGDGELTRFADFNRVMGWMEGARGGDPASVVVEAAPAGRAAAMLAPVPASPASAPAR